MALVSLKEKVSVGYSQYLDLSSWGHQREEIVSQVVARVSSEHSRMFKDIFAGNIEPKAALPFVEKAIKDLSVKTNLPFSYEVIQADAYKRLFGYGPVHDLLEEVSVTDIFLNKPNEIIKRVRGRDDIKTNITFSPKEYENFIRSVVTRLGGKIDPVNNLQDLKDGVNRLRISVGWTPLAEYPWMSIRKHPEEHFSLKQLEESAMFPEKLGEMLRMFFSNPFNILISGPTGSGKTTLFTAGVNECVPKSERVMICESEREAGINRENCLQLQEKRIVDENGKPLQGHTEISDLIRTGMRSAVKRIYLGEMRGKEALSLIRAFGSGHDGGAATLHARNIQSALHQAAFMSLYAQTPLTYDQILLMIVDTVDIAIHLENFRVIEVAEIAGLKDHEVLINYLYKFDINEKTGEPIHHYFEPSSEFARKLRLRKFVRKGGEG
ncbi:ATPase, T2SS/T4P/T4SS family [Heliorestis convoluta]|uniref:ATPase, T2SS/T4P/T4SS family n=1 Tax=Heliorestis convoluta TaxID=356322 RepID=UPI00129B2312|nr:ATPase, T2SS/T4P/T4SS family [Heliorestis convoluta]